MAAFTYQWTNKCRMNMLDDEGEPLDTSAGNNFSKRGVCPGDLVYVIGTWQGPVYLIGRMRVKKVWSREEWDAEHDTPRLWDGEEVVEGEDGTPMRMGFPITLAVLRQLRFQDATGREKGLTITDGTLADPQCIRSVRRLSPMSAELLDELLDVY